MHNNTLACDFLLGIVPDSRGRYVREYYEFDHMELEGCHDWVQWAFPIDTVSMYNPDAPTIDSDFRKYKNILTNSRELLNAKFLEFIGITEAADGSLRGNATLFFQTVNSPDNHNIKRISRILRHNMLAGDGAFAAELLRILLEMALFRSEGLYSNSVAYWCSLVYYPTYPK